MPSLFFVTFLLADVIQAQPYEWRRTMELPTECVAFNPLSKGKTIFVASLADTGIFRSDNGGLTWAQYNEGLQPFSSSRIMQIYCLDSDTNVVLAVSQSSGLYRSTNGGRSWSVALESGGILGEAITWHRSSDVLYYGQNFMEPVWRSDDHGATWVEVGNQDSIITLCTIAVEQEERKRILAGSGEGGIALSDDEGKNWRMVFDIEDPSEVLRPEVPKIVWSTYAPQVAIATRWLSKYNSIVRSLDAGETWERLDIELPRAWALEIDQRPSWVGPLGPNRFWIGLFNRGSDTNVLNSVVETHDAGKTWLSTGMPKVSQVWMVKYDSTSDRLAAATDDGFYVTTAKAGVRQEPSVASARLSNNPAHSHSEVILPEGERLHSIAVYDAAGRLMFTGTERKIELSVLAHGAYRVEVITDHSTHYLPLVIVR
ncbi:MAG TPA: hypothetical protein VFH43_04610 [Candidatus Kapabacteria bacterium]|nr:hypothetical protein [Candidatus Kapabacteria bacterium]